MLMSMWSLKKLDMNCLKDMDLVVCFPYTKTQNLQFNNLKRELFDNDKKVPELRDIILSTDIGQTFNIDSDSDAYTQIIDRQPFNKFKAKHRSMNYSRVFQQSKISKKTDYFRKNRKIKGETVHHYTEDKKCKNQIHPNQIREGFQTILHKVVSKDLIGNGRNKKKILKALYNLLLTAKTESFSLLSLMEQINVSSISWVKSTADEKTKYILVAKFIKWLFQYFITIIYYYFHITYIKEEKVFICLKDWNKQKKDFLKKMNDKMALEPVTRINDTSTVRNILYLVPKYKGVRSITRHIYMDTEKLELRQVLSVLKYLHETYLKSMNDSSFSKQFIEIIGQSNDLEDRKAYIVLADISDAYGSIKQDKLFEILQALFKKLPKELKLEWFMSKSGKKYKFIKSETDTHLFRGYKNKTELVNKYCILNILKEYIFNTKVQIDSKVYNLCKGVAQGLMLSAMLCDIYYSHMRNKYFNYFENFGYFFTYVDDSIFITKSLPCANQYLIKIKKGIPSYNCWYNESKQKSNLSNCNATDENNLNDIEYLGWGINPNSLEIKPKYHLARYSTNFTSLSHSTFEYKLQNLASLKLSRLVLCKEVNSQNQIFNNIRTIAVQQAERCFALASALDHNGKQISIKTIRRVNSKIIRKIEKFSNWDKQEMVQNRKKLWYIMWRSFYNVFNKKSNNFQYLIIRFIQYLKQFNKHK